MTLTILFNFIFNVLKTEFFMVMSPQNKNKLILKKLIFSTCFCIVLFSFSHCNVNVNFNKKKIKYVVQIWFKSALRHYKKLQ